MKNRCKPENILITGGNSGIGAALVKAYAGRRVKHIFLCGRDKGRLDEIVAQCQSPFTKVTGVVLDVTDAPALETWVKECDATAPLELVIANAGVGVGGEETPQNIRQTFEINVGGVLNTVLPAIELFESAAERKRNMRQIAIMSSLTGYHGLPSCPAYSASKACVKAWGAGLRGSLRQKDILVSTICPGFVRSRLTDKNKFHMPFFMEADQAANIIIDRLERNVGLITFPWPMRLAVWLAACLPDVISDWLFRNLKISR